MLYSYVATRLHWREALAASVTVLAFYWLDTYFLRQERLFRCFWSDAVQRESSVSTFDLDIRPYQNKKVYSRPTWRSTMASPPLLVLYGSLFTVGLMILLASLVAR